MREVLAAIAKHEWVRRTAMRTPGLRTLARRFVAGESLDAGLQAVRALNQSGVRATLNFLGSHALREEDAAAAAEAAIESLRRIRAARLDSTVSIKLTNLGLDLDPELCRLHLRRILEAARETRNFVRIDMEESAYVDETLRLFEEARGANGDAVGLVLQSYLRRTERDLERLVASGARIRIVKGGYWETGDGVYREKDRIDAAFERDVTTLLRRGRQPAIATHDTGAIALAQRIARLAGRQKDEFEFQMMYGVRSDVQEALVAGGYGVRSYVPYGDRWYDYVLGCVRRLPAGALGRLNERLHGSEVP